MTVHFENLTLDWLGYATLRVEADDTTIYFDPGRYGVLTGEWEPHVEGVNHPQARDYDAQDGDVVLVTHIHHYDPDGIRRVASDDATVVLFEGIDVHATDRDVDRPVDLDHEVVEVTMEDELVAADVTARRALLAFLHRYSPQVEAVQWTCPEESRLVHEATDPDAVSASIEPGAMGRVVDVQAALAALPADRNPADPLAIMVRDALLETNDGSFAIEAGPDGPVVERLAADVATAITLDVRQLSRLFVGTTPVATLVEREGLSATDATISALDDLFPPRRVFLPDFY